MTWPRTQIITGNQGRSSGRTGRTPAAKPTGEAAAANSDSAFGNSGNGAIEDVWPSLWLAGTFNLLALPRGAQGAQHAAAGPRSRPARLTGLGVPQANRSKSQHYVKNVAANT